MMNIAPTNNYNTNFKGMDYGKIYKEMEKISLLKEEKIVPKKTVKPIKKLSIINKLYNTILDCLFKTRLMRPVSKRYDNNGNTILKQYKSNAYRKYAYRYNYPNCNELILSEEKFPSGLKKYYKNEYGDSMLSKEKFPDGTVKYYENTWLYDAYPWILNYSLIDYLLPSNARKIYLAQEILPDGTKKIFKQGKLIEILDENGKVIKSNLYTESISR